MKHDEYLSPTEAIVGLLVCLGLVYFGSYVFLALLDAARAGN